MLPVASQSNGFDNGTELEFGDALVLIVVPDHDLGRRILWMLAAANERQYIASKQHLYNADTAMTFPF